MYLFIKRNLKFINNHKNEMVKDYEEYTNIIINNKDNIFCKSLLLGITNKTLDEILYEKKYKINILWVYMIVDIM